MQNNSGPEANSIVDKHKMLISVDRSIEALVTLLLIPALLGYIAIFIVPIFQGNPVLESSPIVAGLFSVSKPLLLLALITKIWKVCAHVSRSENDRYTPEWTKIVRKLLLPIVILLMVVLVGGLAYIFQNG